MELIATGTEPARDHGDNLCDAKGLSKASPTRMNFSWSSRPKSIHEQVIAVTCCPPSSKGKGSAVARAGCSQAAWEQLLHSGTSRSLDVGYWNKKKAQSPLSE